MAANTDLSQNTIEHERRFLVNLGRLPFILSDYPNARILQGYLGDPSRIRVRDEFRNKKHTYSKTIKSGEGVSRFQDEQEISKDEFNLLWSQVKHFLEKERYFIPYEGCEIQLNIFFNNLSDYYQIEVEFSSSETALSFVPPNWFGDEVTYDHRHDSFSLAKNGMPK